jgi:hypothetical protein
MAKGIKYKVDIPRKRKARITLTRYFPMRATLGWFIL